MSHPILSSKWPLLAIAPLASLAVATPALADEFGPFGWVKPITDYAMMVQNLWVLMMWICIAILVVVEAALVYALVKFRKRENDPRAPETWNHNTTLEILWTVIPFALLIVILVPTFQALVVFANVPKAPDYTLEVIGHQFFWEYRYPDLGVQFNSSPRMDDKTLQEPLYIPVDKQLKLVLTGSDVIHGWWVPALGFQEMTTPGSLVQVPLKITKVGDYTGACAYLCGTLHGAMNIKLKVVDQPTFETWVAKQGKKPLDPITKVGKIGMVAPPPGKEEPEGQKQPEGAKVDPKALVAKGSSVFASKCAGCHGAAGAGVPGVFPPLAGSEQVNGKDEEIIKILNKGLNGPIKVKGVAYSGAMPAWQGQLTDEEIAGVIDYVRDSWGNNKKYVTPAQVKAGH